MSELIHTVVAGRLQFRLSVMVILFSYILFVCFRFVLDICISLAQRFMAGQNVGSYWIDKKWRSCIIPINLNGNHVVVPIFR